MATTSLVGLPAPHRRQRPVLVVEDSAEVRDFLETLLTDEGYRCVSRSGPDDAVALLRTFRFALILTDSFRGTATEPTEVGAATVALRAAAGATPVVPCTAHAIAEEDALAAGFAALMIKPFEIEALLATIARLFAPPGAVA